MALDLKQMEKELLASPLQSPYSTPLAVAVVSDALRLGGLVPPLSGEWAPLQKAHAARLGEQVGVLAHLLASTSLRDTTVVAIHGAPRPALPALTAFFDLVEPLTAEMVRANAFRREEFVRKWLFVWGGEVAGETAEQMKKKMEQLDYRKTLAEYAKAETARKAEAEKRAAALKAAQEAEAASRGWRE
jgi:hypothetical protein